MLRNDYQYSPTRPKAAAKLKMPHDNIFFTSLLLNWSHHIVQPTLNSLVTFSITSDFYQFKQTFSKCLQTTDYRVIIQNTIKTSIHYSR